MSKKKFKLGIKPSIVHELTDAQAYVIKNGKDKYLEVFGDLVDSLNDAEKKIESYVDDKIPDGIKCSVYSVSHDYISGLVSGDSRYDNIDMFYTVIEFYCVNDEEYFGNVVFGIDRSSYNNGTDSISVVCFMNINQELDNLYDPIVEELIKAYKDKANGIMSIMGYEDFITYLVADKFVEDHQDERVYLETLNEVGLPAYFEITTDRVDDTLKLARQKIEMFSKRVSETTKYIVSAIRSDNNNMYVLFNDKENGELKFSYQVDFHTEDAYINVANGSKISKKKLGKMVERFKSLHDVEFLLEHVYEIFKVIVYCQTFKKTLDVLPN
jgi:hypothetical protein